ncbi:MAG: division/cell wall cluster transcriptional repressor MraZ [Burkholderiales bacterium]|nr:division/cell wall cluster transcriptional repressor MraZ [Burkholderiales bacterium]
MFQGGANLSLDAKGRMSVPARHRDVLQLQCEGRLTLTKHPHGCLLLFPRPVWEGFREKLAALPMEARAWQRIFLGSAADVELDGAGRLLIAPELRAAAQLTKDVTLLGMGSHLEIWDSALLAQKEAEAIAQGMPEAIAGFSF